MRGLKALLVLSAVVVTGAAHAQPLLIRNSYVVPVANWEPMIVEKKDLAKHWGKSYVMEAVRYQGTPTMITALANGELEIANLAYSTLGIAIENAGISDLRVISDDFRDGVPGYFSNQFFVRKDSGIKKIEDLKGKVLATNAIGAGVDIAMKAGLKKHGLIDKRDFTVIEAPLPTMPNMLNDKKADLVTAVVPFAFNPMLNDIGVPLFDQTLGLGPSQFVFWTARQSWIDKNRPALVDYMEDMLRITRWYLDPKNHAEATQIASKLLRVPADRLGWLYTKKDYYRDPDMMPDLVALQRNVDVAVDLGIFKSRVDVKKHADLSLIQEAAKRLK
ncbi:MAG TPA: ABC transporter substrate-binding protein [Reyranella sp.]|nr:ABC transporter substrate-binding protein [Reyranella sp.]